MNFLFITTILILIFSLISTSMTLSLSSTTFAHSQLMEQSKNLIEMQNSLQKKKFKKNTSSKKISDTQRKLKRAGKRFHPRHNCVGENSKLNLITFTYDNMEKEDRENTLLQNTLANLLKLLYQDEPYFKEKLVLYPSLFKTLSIEIKNGIAVTKSLAKVPFIKNHNRKLFVKMCNGSFTTKNKPKLLLNYITLQDTNKKAPIVFSHASISLLEAFFGSEITKSILDKERKLYFNGSSKSRISKYQLERICRNSHFLYHKKLLCFKPYKFTNVQQRKKSILNDTITLGL